MWKMAALAFRRWTGKVTPLLHNGHTTEPPLISESKQMFGTFTGYWTKCQSETWGKKKNKCSHFRAEIITASLWELAINKSKATEGTKQITLHIEGMRNRRRPDIGKCISFGIRQQEDSNWQLCLFLFTEDDMIAMWRRGEQLWL